ncbi:spermidine synthase-like protein [Thioalkalivibrio nitratireducens]|nr:spermidine synthase-like protein [Thioalkalivibrio nitratireducens]
MSPAPRFVSWSVALASAAVIAFQLVVMQLLAVSQWHHFAYMVISTALLGFGAAGTTLVLLREPLKRHYATALPLLYVATAVTMAATVWLSGVFGDFDTFLLFFEPGQVGLLVFLYLVYALPFFFAGLAITLVFYREVERIGWLYFANMAGSGAGAVLVLGLLWALPPERLSAVLALAPLLAAWITRPRSVPKAAAVAVASAALLVPLIGLVNPAGPQPSEYKPIHAALLLPGAEVIHSASSPYGLLQVVRADAQRFAPSLSLQYRDEPPVRDVMFNNGEYYGTLLGRAGTGGVYLLDHTTRGLSYAVRDPESVLVLEAGAGEDVAHALGHGAATITAVEPHRQANRLLRDRYPEWIDSIYRDPAVTLQGTTVRSYLARRVAQDYDLIVLPTLGAFGGTSGVYALREQYGLTLEAFLAMWDALGERGMIAVTVWQDEPPRKPLRLLATWRTLLEREGIGHAPAHVAAVRSWGTTTYLLSRTAFSATERGHIREFAQNLAFDLLLLEDVQSGERDRFNRLPDRSFLEHVDILLHGDPAALFDNYLFDIGPATDDRPFFGQFIRLSGILELQAIYGTRELPYMELGLVLAAVTLLQIVLAAVILIVLPLFRVGWQGTRRRWTLLYFSATGIGFMFFEIVLIQKLVLYLGQPVYATAAVLGTLLVCSGVGSLLSSRIAATRRNLVVTGVAIAGLILVYAHGLMPVLELSMSAPMTARAVVVFLLLAPPAVLMGMMFPFGLRRLAGSDETHIPWACGIDSCLSVSATALATLIALGTGLAFVMQGAAVAYLVVALASLRLGRAL